MFVRLTFCKFSPERIKEAKKIYNDEIVPVVKKQKGNLGIRLLEPIELSDDYISVSEWKTKADADAYVASGTYKKLVSMLDSFFTKSPSIRSYNVAEAKVRATIL